MSDKINRPSKAKLKKQLSPEAYAVTQEAERSAHLRGNMTTFMKMAFM